MTSPFHPAPAWRKEPAPFNVAFEIAQLRHLYALMINGHVKHPDEAARGLLGPVIQSFERAYAPPVAPPDAEAVTAHDITLAERSIKVMARDLRATGCAIDADRLDFAADVLLKLARAAGVKK